eukprot:13865594-Alexandrium_andersonii.AAC.1
MGDAERSEVLHAPTRGGSGTAENRASWPTPLLGPGAEAPRPRAGETLSGSCPRAVRPRSRPTAGLQAEQ